MRSTIDEDKYEERNISIMIIIKVDKNDLRNNFPKWYRNLENQSIFDLFLFSWNIVKLFIN